MMIHETRSRAHSSGDEEKIMTKKQKAEGKEHESEHSPKKAKNGNGNSSGKSRDKIAAEFERLCVE
ncbi:unnamed protein product [Ilex paraguariensis]|uniref:Uncharacterized protein n=1 Tax=Ilex paraguariensis TaxID=185542 RepID=A0ABC8UUK3_9AQUA